MLPFRFFGLVFGFWFGFWLLGETQGITPGEALECLYGTPGSNPVQPTHCTNLPPMLLSQHRLSTPDHQQSEYSPDSTYSSWGFY